MRFGEFIAARRAELQITGEDFIKATGYDKSYLSLIETGRQNPTKETPIKAIAKLLNIKNWRWLQVYSFLDEDPRIEFGNAQPNDPQINALTAARLRWRMSCAPNMIRSANRVIRLRCRR